MGERKYNGLWKTGQRNHDSDTQDLVGKAFPLFSLVEGQTYVDYDLIYIYHDMLFNGSKMMDGRGSLRLVNQAGKNEEDQRRTLLKTLVLLHVHTLSSLIR